MISCSALALTVVALLGVVVHDAQAHSFKLRKHKVQGHKNVARHYSRFSRRQVDPAPLDVDNLYDLYYSTFVTVGGQELEVQLDTGSSELWVRPKQGYTSPVDFSNVSLSVRYGIGSFQGALSSAEAVMGDLRIPKQYFLNYTTGNINNVFQAGLDGMLGLGFDQGSHIMTSVRQRTSDDSGRTLLSNFFIANPSEPRTISFFMSRNNDPDSSADGLFMVGEPEPEYASVKAAPALPVHVNKQIGDFQRWSTYVDAVEVNGVNITGLKSVVAGAPTGRLVANIDTGTSLAWVPSEVVDAIYKGIEGSKYFADTDQYTVPCLSAPRIAIWFSGQRFAIHPMDASRVQSQLNADGKREFYCTNTFIHTKALSDQTATLDMQLGDSFLRNVISNFAFGDPSDPSTANIRMVSTVTDELDALNTFYEARAKQVGVTPPPPATALPGAPGQTPGPTGTTTGTETSFPTPPAPPGAPPTVPETNADPQDTNQPAQNPGSSACAVTVVPTFVLVLSLLHVAWFL